MLNMYLQFPFHFLPLSSPLEKTHSLSLNWILCLHLICAHSINSDGRKTHLQRWKKNTLTSTLTLIMATNLTQVGPEWRVWSSWYILLIQLRLDFPKWLFNPLYYLQVSNVSSPIFTLGSLFHWNTTCNHDRLFHRPPPSHLSCLHLCPYHSR